MPISSRLHVFFDYLASLALITAPWTFHFFNLQQFAAATWTPIAVGCIGLLMSLMTRYELSAVQVIPYRIHLSADLFLGAFLAASPWLFGFASYVYQPHLAIGLVTIVVTTLSQRATVVYHKTHDYQDRLMPHKI